MEVILTLIIVAIFGLTYLVEKATGLVKQLKASKSQRLLGPGKQLELNVSVSLKDKNKEACATQRKPQKKR